jgi:hypothetical protein
VRTKKLYVCKKCKNSDCLMKVLNKSDSRLVPVGCQKICAGPVVGVKVTGQMEWFSRVNSLKEIAGLRMLADRRTKRPARPLEKRRLAKRSGRAPR